MSIIELRGKRRIDRRRSLIRKLQLGHQFGNASLISKPKLTKTSSNDVVSSLFLLIYIIHHILLVFGIRES